MFFPHHFINASIEKTMGWIMYFGFADYLLFVCEQSFCIGIHSPIGAAAEIQGRRSHDDAQS